MKRHRNLALPVAVLGVMATANGCANGPTVHGSFDRSFTVTGHTRLDLTNASGDITITGSTDGKVHVRGEVSATGSDMPDSQRRLSETESNPPVEQTPDGVRIGKDMFRMHNASISYTIEVPRDTEVSATVASGTQLVRGVRGPVKVQSASGSIRVEDVEREAQLISLSGSVEATNIGDTVRASSTSGTIAVSGAKGDVRVNGLAGSIQVVKPGGRVDADAGSGTIDVQGATSDVKAHAVSGRVAVTGNPGVGVYWDLRTISGGVNISVPKNANLHLLAEATSGEIRTDIPIMVEEQGKHSLRAQLGTGGGRVEIHTTSGEIRVNPAN
jgi:DUF4097 and DUF4098 domain-containing protein YvlB